uniref:Transmembrane protein n=1 Tax=Heterorhabditis bacteriophora TaxID=37862 RepID=A0A1I7XEQ5_HETBA
MAERNRSKCHCCAVFHPIVSWKRWFKNTFKSLLMNTKYLQWLRIILDHFQSLTQPSRLSGMCLLDSFCWHMSKMIRDIRVVDPQKPYPTFDPHLELEHIGVIAFNIVLKITLFFVCFVRRDVDQVKVLLKDQGVDVITNTTAVFFSILTKYLHKNWDIVGAVIIFVTICRNWTPILFTNCIRIHGVAPKQKKIDTIKKAIEQSKLVNTVHDIVVYHRGQDVVVEECNFSLKTVLYDHNFAIHL